VSFRVPLYRLRSNQIVHESVHAGTPRRFVVRVSFRSSTFVIAVEASGGVDEPRSDDGALSFERETSTSLRARLLRDTREGICRLKVAIRLDRAAVVVSHSP
jgi:hypothetical protein